MAFTVPNEYGYVLLSALTTGFVHIYHQILTGKKRAAAKIAYPAAYADNALAEKDPKANAFNCAQRAHAHFTENLTPYLLDMAVAGLRFPLIAAGCGLLWSVGRVVYAYGYVNIGPKARHTGGRLVYLAAAPVKLLALYTAAGMALGF